MQIELKSIKIADFIKCSTNVVMVSMTQLH